MGGVIRSVDWDFDRPQFGKLVDSNQLFEDAWWSANSQTVQGDGTDIGLRRGREALSELALPAA